MLAFFLFGYECIKIIKKNIFKLDQSNLMHATYDCTKSLHLLLNKY